jgi:hypothetical protein
MKLKLMLLQVWSIFVPEGQHITALKVAAGRAISKITRQIIARRNGDRWRLLARRLLDRALVRVWSGVKAEVAGQREAVTAAEQAVLIAQREVEMLDAPDQEDVSGQLMRLGMGKQLQQGRLAQLHMQQPQQQAQQQQGSGSSTAHRELMWLSLGGLDGGYWSRKRRDSMVEDHSVLSE